MGIKTACPFQGDHGRHRSRVFFHHRHEHHGNVNLRASWLPPPAPRSGFNFRFVFVRVVSGSRFLSAIAFLLPTIVLFPRYTGWQGYGARGIGDGNGDRDGGLRLMMADALRDGGWMPHLFLGCVGDVVGGVSPGRLVSLLLSQRNLLVFRRYQLLELFSLPLANSLQSSLTFRTCARSDTGSDAHEAPSRARGESRVVGAGGELASCGEWRRGLWRTRGAQRSRRFGSSRAPDFRCHGVLY
jgi:hypothetical protein